MIYNQYSNAVKVRQFLNEMAGLINFSVDDFRRDFFDIDTAKTDGLLNWGLILDQANYIEVPDYTGAFGFSTNDDPGPPALVPAVPIYPQNFDNSWGFWEGKKTLIKIEDEAYRKILKLKYRILNTNNSYNEINSIMHDFIYSINQSYQFRIIEPAPMTLEYQFNFHFDNSTEKIYYLIITNQLLFPRPHGPVITVIFDAIF